MGIDGAEILILAGWVVVPVVALVAIALLVHRVVRRAVAGGIRDARAADAAPPAAPGPSPATPNTPGAAPGRIDGTSPSPTASPAPHRIP